MPIPNVSSLYKRINGGAEGGHEFARLLKVLLGAHFAGLGAQLRIRLKRWMFLASPLPSQFLDRSMGFVRM